MRKDKTDDAGEREEELLENDLEQRRGVRSITQGRVAFVGSVGISPMVRGEKREHVSTDSACR